MFDAIVLAGGAARRLGGVDKPAQQIGGTSLLARVVAAAAAARRVVVVGPRREPVDGLPRDVVWRRESPPGTGPVAAVAAGLGATSAPTLLVLAADLPYVAPAVAPLLDAVAGGAELALLVDETGRVNHLAGAWRRDVLAAALDSLGGGAGAAMRSLVAAAGEPTLVPDDGGWGRDCDTWDDLADARARLGRR